MPSPFPPAPPGEPIVANQCAEPTCHRVAFGDPLYCELHRARKPHIRRGPSGYGSVEPGASEWSRWMSEGRDMRDK